ncbi:DASH family cryptochrome [Pedobacter cryotolerans]|uniref:Cryptochrome DASH n=1 Tax=Pedobacter cryotolerans TaxID=2571270 RepID=A0A4U1C332_9SPHI|nr:DASH family cryptochrome [Pedobacter cryotolerans]TKB99609.1 DASH family cryptochrome [Pedobacter cryotolerans]
MSKKILVWFRNDLRLHDNEMLVEALAKSDEILPVFCFDPRQFEPTSYQTIKTGSIRTKFLIESVKGLREALQALGGDILIVQGKPEEVLPELVNQYEIAEVYHHREVASEETEVSTLVEDLLWKQKVNLRHFIGHTLYNKEDLPFPIKDIPDVFAQFKKKTERDAIVKPCFVTPQQISFVNVEAWGDLPTLDQLAINENIEAITTQDEIIGGENEALTHLHEFLHTGEGMALSNTSLKKNTIISKLSAWLALGCLSPREVYWKMKDAEANYGLKPYFNQIILGLLWRDYFRFMFKKYGNTFFKPKGFSLQPNKKYDLDTPLLNAWKSGNTAQPLVNSLMIELNTTGYLSNAARQLVATYLVYELNIKWVYGAAYFEEKLIDYAPASNWGNWANLAGVGNDLRLTTSFDFQKLVKIVDPKGIYTQELRA